MPVWTIAAGCSATTRYAQLVREGAVDVHRAHQRQPGHGVGDGLRVDRQQAARAGGVRGLGPDRVGRALPFAPTTVTRSIENTGDERRIE